MSSANLLHLMEYVEVSVTHDVFNVAAGSMLRKTVEKFSDVGEAVFTRPRQGRCRGRLLEERSRQYVRGRGKTVRKP